MRGISLTHPVLSSIVCKEIHLHHHHIFSSGDFLLHIPCWLHFYLGSFPYTSRAGFIFIWGVSLTHSLLASFLSVGVSLTHPILASILSGEFLLHITCWLHFLLHSEKRKKEKKCFEENRAVWNAKKNRNTKTWVGEDLSKFSKTRRH